MSGYSNSEISLDDARPSRPSDLQRISEQNSRINALHYQLLATTEIIERALRQMGRGEPLGDTNVRKLMKVVRDNRKFLGANP